MSGIVGGFDKKKVSQNIFSCLYNTQTRGQENCGIIVAGDDSVRPHAGKRLISSVFYPSVVKSFFHPSDYVAIGHVGDRKVERDYIQPFIVSSENYELSLTMDGMIIDYGKFDRMHSDEELIATKFLECMEKNDDEKIACERILNDFDNAYFSLIAILHDKERETSKLVGLRDKRGIKPMYMGRTNGGLYITSESCAIDNLESFGNTFSEKRDVAPGEMIMIDPKFIHFQLVEPERAHCAFEWIYIARPDSVIEGQNAHMVRKRTGHLLVELHKLENDLNSVVIPTPDSGRSVALGIAEASGIPYDEGQIKNQFIGRTYPIPDETERKTAAGLKHNPIRAVVKGKRVFEGDDSIVRGTISEAIANTVKVAGAKEVYWTISYAPIRYPCFCDPSNKKLAMNGYTGDTNDIFEMGKYVASKLDSIDGVMYNSVENVIKAIGLPEEHLCTMCITGKNPFKR